MAIDIKGLTVGQSQTNGSSRADKSKANQQVDAQDSSKDSGGSGGDTVKISADSKVLQAARQKIDDTPVVNEQKVEAIRNAIEDGTYEVDSKKLADSIVNFEDLL